MLTLGLVVNPVAGLGGRTALRGSDGVGIQRAALARGAVPAAGDRTARALARLASAAGPVPWQLLAWGGDMGAAAAAAAGVACRVLGQPPAESTAADTVAAARAMVAAGCDLLVFAGGDGTARDICRAVPAGQLCLGIPAGVKIHSGVYAVTPEAAGELLAAIARLDHVSVVAAPVRDIDEQALRAGVVRTRHFGELQVPQRGQYLQHVKEGGLEVDGLVVEEIAADVLEHMLPDVPVLLGTGSTLLAVKQRLGLDGTLLGVDVVRNGAALCLDATASDLEHLAAAGPVQLVVTPIGGQGFLFGRGNQQFSPAVLHAATDIMVVSTRRKLLALAGRPLLVDTGDPALDRALARPVQVVTGYDDRVLWQIAAPDELGSPVGGHNGETQ